MAGYIGKSQGVTQVDGYNRTEADGRYVNASGDTMTGQLIVSGEQLTLNSGNGNFVSATVDGAIEIRRAGGGGYIDFHGSDVDFDARIQHTASHSLAFNTGGNGNTKTAMELDASGRVTMPYQPAFNATALSYEVLGSGWQLISYNQSVSQRGSSYNATTSTFTASVSGWYQFNASWSAVNNSDIDGTFALVVNGSIAANFGTVSMSNTGANYDGHVISACTYLAANDYVNVWRYSTVQTTTREYDWTGNFSGYLIG